MPRIAQLVAIATIDLKRLPLLEDGYYRECTTTFMAQPGNREWVTVIQGTSAGGWAIPPFIIVAGRYELSNWFGERVLPQDWVVATTQNGWTNKAEGLHWIKHFDQHTRHKKVGAYRLLIINGHESHHSMEFEQYFGAQHYHAVHARTLLSYPPAPQRRLLCSIEACLRPTYRKLDIVGDHIVAQKLWCRLIPRRCENIVLGEVVLHHCP
jgi:hypothetical protein